MGFFFLGPRWLSILPAAVMDSIIIQERLVERLLSPRTQAQRSHPAKLKVRGCIYSPVQTREQQGQEGGRMVPEKTCAAGDETSEEQRSGKTLVRERWRGQKRGEQPRWEQVREARWTAGRSATYFCAVL